MGGSCHKYNVCHGKGFVATNSVVVPLSISVCSDKSETADNETLTATGADVTVRRLETIIMRHSL